MSTAHDFEVQTGLTHGSVVVYFCETPGGERIRYLATPLEGVTNWGVGLLILRQLGVTWFSPQWPIASHSADQFKVLDEIKAVEKHYPAIKDALEEIEFRKALDNAAVDKLYDGMTERLACKRLEGRKGWEDAPEQVLRDLFYDAVSRDSLIGAANYLAFMHQRGISLLPAPPKKVHLQIDVDTTQATAKVKELRDQIYGMPGMSDGGPIKTVVGAGPDPVEQECKVQLKIEPEPDPILQRLDHIAHTLDLIQRTQVETAR